MGRFSLVTEFDRAASIAPSGVGIGAADAAAFK